MATKEIPVEEVAEQVIEFTPELPTVAVGSKVLTWGLLSATCIVWAASGYVFAKKRLEKKYQEIAQEEIDLIRDLYFEKEKKLSIRVDSGPVKEPLEHLIEKQGYGVPTPEDQRYTEAEQAAIDRANAEAAQAELEAEPEITSVFADHVDEWDWEIEKQIREEGHDEVPYVITNEEFDAKEHGWDHVTLTYFEGDDVLADDQDVPVDDQDAMVGLGNLQKFGHGSGDPNVVYVRNPELHIEIEIVHSDKKFVDERRDPTIPPRDEKGRFQPKVDDPPPSGDPRHRRSRG